MEKVMEVEVQDVVINPRSEPGRAAGGSAEGAGGVIETAKKKVVAPRGMTLVEIMVVIGIIGTITVVLATGVLSSSDDADISATTILVKNISTQLTMHKSRAREYPNSLQVLVERGSLQEDQLNDPWGKALAYSTNGRSDYELCSGGPDGNVGGSDDICVVVKNGKMVQSPK